MFGIKTLKPGDTPDNCFFCNEEATSYLYAETETIYLCGTHRNHLRMMFVDPEKKIEVPEKLLWKLVEKSLDE